MNVLSSSLLSTSHLSPNSLFQEYRLGSWELFNYGSTIAGMLKTEAIDLLQSTSRWLLFVDDHFSQYTFRFFTDHLWMISLFRPPGDHFKDWFDSDQMCFSFKDSKNQILQLNLSNSYFLSIIFISLVGA